LPYGDKASLENALHVINFLIENDFSGHEIESSIRHMQPVAMRLEKIKGINNCVLINDAYNSDINALGIALDYLNQQPLPEKCLIISDIQQSGQEKSVLYQQVASLVRSANVDTLVGIGEEINDCKALFKDIHSEFFLSTTDFIDQSGWSKFKSMAILVKGARGFHFERMVNLLSEKNHTTVLEINLNSLADNLNYFRSLLTGSTGIMVMVKALAYGSGGTEIASLLQHEQVNYLGVAFTDEGVKLRQSDIHLPIMVMAPSTEDFRRIIEYDLEPEIYSFRILEKFIETAGNLQVNNYPVHIKLDTGMHRLGFLPEEITGLLQRLKSTSVVKVHALFSHLAASDEPSFDNFTRWQIELFNSTYIRFVDVLGYKPMRHILNSAGIERFSEAHFEMVRLGIGLHGISSVKANLIPVSTLKTHIVQIKELCSGETVGYGRHGKINKKSRIAIIPIGYADGLDRKLGNGIGYVLLNGEKANFIGNICMDMSMIDITKIDCTEGDEVIVFGENPSIKEVADQIGTIPYEVLTSISSRVKRIFSKD
jgi:alanine racemase